MIQLNRITAKFGFIVSFLFIFSLFVNNVSAQGDADQGKALFQTNCSSCHSLFKDATGPALTGVEDRWPSRDKIHAWVHNSSAVLASGDQYANALFAKYNKTAMTKFQGILSDKDIDAILDYIKAAKPPVAPAAGQGGSDAAQSSGSDNSLLYIIVTGILLVAALVLWQVNNNLKKLADKKEGHATIGNIPWFRNKKIIAFIAILIFISVGFWLSSNAISINRQFDYEPRQPIFYSHKVHAGINQINCLYCHTNAQYSRHATIPPLNVCMNCHKAINSYSGPALKDAEGNDIDGSAEIQKLYSYAGFKPGPGAVYDPSKAKPIPWIRIHNLPDHVYFNHSQHVMVGKVQCQTCHGEINKMDEVKQFAPLTMGWCVNCHRTTAVQFKDNGFYSIYEKYHQELKDGKIDSVTVQMIGGTDCQKCHY